MEVEKIVILHANETAVIEKNTSAIRDSEADCTCSSGNLTSDDFEIDELKQRSRFSSSSDATQVATDDEGGDLADLEIDDLKTAYETNSVYDYPPSEANVTFDDILDTESDRHPNYEIGSIYEYPPSNIDVELVDNEVLSEYMGLEDGSPVHSEYMFDDDDVADCSVYPTLPSETNVEL